MNFSEGKVNEGENGLETMVRKIYKEMGFDSFCSMGVSKSKEEEMGKAPCSPLSEEDFSITPSLPQEREDTLCRRVPEDFHFEPVARKEISCVAWHDLEKLPKKSWAVSLFV